MKKYVTPECTVIRFDATDIIATSATIERKVDYADDTKNVTPPSTGVSWTNVSK